MQKHAVSVIYKTDEQFTSIYLFTVINQMMTNNKLLRLKNCRIRIRKARACVIIGIFRSPVRL